MLKISHKPLDVLEFFSPKMLQNVKQQIRPNHQNFGYVYLKQKHVVQETIGRLCYCINEKNEILSKTLYLYYCSKKNRKNSKLEVLRPCQRWRFLPATAPKTVPEKIPPMIFLRSVPWKIPAHDRGGVCLSWLWRESWGGDVQGTSMLQGNCGVNLINCVDVVDCCSESWGGAKSLGFGWSWRRERRVLDPPRQHHGPADLRVFLGRILLCWWEVWRFSPASARSRSSFFKQPWVGCDGELGRRCIWEERGFESLWAGLDSASILRGAVRWECDCFPWALNTMLWPRVWMKRWFFLGCRALKELFSS